MRSDTELAALMSKGLKMQDVYEDTKFFINIDYSVCLVCALGAAIVGLYEDTNKAYQAIQQEIDGSSNWKQFRVKASSKLLNIDPELAEFIDTQHLSGTPISKIILFLEARDILRKAEDLQRRQE